MPEFSTPEPISVIVRGITANATFHAADRADTIVEVTPTDPGDDSDIRTAEAVRVSYAAGKLAISGPRRRRMLSMKSEAFDVRVHLPAGSAVDCDVASGGFAAGGRLGDSRFKTVHGDVILDETTTARIETTMGRVVLERAAGRVEIDTGTGDVEVGHVDGPAVLKNLNGDIRIRSITGDLRVNAVNSTVHVGRAGDGVTVKATTGGVQLAEVVRGRVDLDIATGDLEVGIGRGSAAWLDVSAAYGHVHNMMTPATEPAETEHTVEVRARTMAGDITIHRS